MFFSKLFMISIIIVVFMSHCSASVIANTIFYKANLCDVSKRIDQGCSERVTNDKNKPRNLLQCARFCKQEEFCSGASVDEKGECFLHRNCGWETRNDSNRSCSVENTNHHFMAKLCVHGAWNVGSQSCQCYKGTSGPRCEVYLKDCWERHARGVRGQETVFINPDGDRKTVFTIGCRSEVNLQVRNMVFASEGKVSFNKTWEEYANGFFIDDRNYWTGLNAWHKLTSSRVCQISISVFFTSGYRTRVYSNAAVSDEAHNFTLTVGSSHVHGISPAPQTIGDCLGSLVGTPFSTWDRVNDGRAARGVNCAAGAGSGWWWPNNNVNNDSGGHYCGNPCHLLGLKSDLASSAKELWSVSRIDMEQYNPSVTYVRINIMEELGSY